MVKPEIASAGSSGAALWFVSISCYSFFYVSRSVGPVSFYFFAGFFGIGQRQGGDFFAWVFFFVWNSTEKGVTRSSSRGERSYLVERVDLMYDTYSS